MMNRRLAAISVSTEAMHQYLNNARIEERKTFALNLSEKLTTLSDHISQRELNSIEAIELIRQVAENLKAISEGQH
ncbi:TPA: DUF2732 family protein [Yersinia enterocolitica]|uniref:DUF2732 family protein n=1 Tax=Yersinia enterocolitica TaxID=630 RepID=UPI0005DC265B|nr:DUF2732 family protein [Yersinia enterocolitica]CNK34079.1 Protein of uncharacterised function (DUF2732) [Yersinia enterocolitica]HDL6510042.1 DUF2732 family protein [Yersinia enterocolitica]